MVVEYLDNDGNSLKEGFYYNHLSKGYEIFRVTPTPTGWVLNGNTVRGAELIVELTPKNAEASRNIVRIEDPKRFLDQRTEERDELRSKLNNLEQVISFISEN